MSECTECLVKYREKVNGVEDIPEPHLILKPEANISQKLIELYHEARVARERYIAALANEVMNHDARPEDREGLRGIPRTYTGSR